MDHQSDSDCACACVHVSVFVRQTANRHIRLLLVNLIDWWDSLFQSLQYAALCLVDVAPVAKL